ncbi:hypothetical protein JOC94_002948 [Bacillus thermophilus]|uniref:Uncharacterized protein n=1 Tax=Siminovitchia thermophila TaxID=1245522 RepID=A0ABS2R8G0_9BACI|nr:hypothetical protein [Siminovitchia thermophila]MBM7715937.1 hypothetical protein [Siminovitchia thermophila]ONK21570.1 hypothetical protein BLX87_20295 [Bacillus sp. VT-16-64]
MEHNKLMKEAARYKKWFERYSLNPFAYDINGRKYHYVIYHGSKTSDFKGYAIISLDGGPKSEYREAIFPLKLMSAAGHNIFNLAGPRSKVLPEYFKGVIDAVETHFSNDPTMREGNQLFKELMNLQVRFNNLFHEYKNYYDNDLLVKKEIIDHDIDYTLTVAAKLDLFQFKQGLILEKMDNHFSEFFQKVMKEKKVFSTESRQFIKGMQSSKDSFEQGMAEFTYERDIMHLSEEEQIELKKEHMIKTAEKLIQDREKQLRGPAAL